MQSDSVKTIGMAIFCHLNLISWLVVRHQHYYEVANWLYTRTNTVYDSDTLIIYGPNAPLIAWQDYYLMQKWRNAPLDIIVQCVITPEDIERKNVIYLYYEPVPILPSVTNTLEAQFEQVEIDGELKVATFIRKGSEVVA